MLSLSRAQWVFRREKQEGDIRHYRGSTNLTNKAQLTKKCSVDGRTTWKQIGEGEGGRGRLRSMDPELRDEEDRGNRDVSSMWAVRLEGNIR